MVALPNLGDRAEAVGEDDLGVGLLELRALTDEVAVGVGVVGPRRDASAGGVGLGIGGEKEPSGPVVARERLPEVGGGWIGPTRERPAQRDWNVFTAPDSPIWTWYVRPVGATWTWMKSTPSDPSLAVIAGSEFSSALPRLLR